MGLLSAHEIIEHEDGTITVYPSMAIGYTTKDGRQKGWHGALVNGIWKPGELAPTEEL